QIAILEKERTLDAAILSRYIPLEPSRSSLPVFVKDQSKEDFSERDILYKVLFDMKKDMVDLKKLVVELIQNGVNPSSFDENSQYINQLYNEVKPVPAQLYPHEEMGVTPTIIHNPSSNNQSSSSNYVSLDTQDAEEVEESLSLVDKESDLIKKALKKHKGKRKAAAQELGISERTLYRKIKDLNLE
ncbi:MAG TPA: helix-turn-helix domain-containing protein, partial [Sphingobacterium bovisgrunnientis]|nr:helix-turn-helix domain-containing protein [Sphingobacterium bovisgrunnientis]